jgi:probable HAF family extracellular repeat protein
MVGLGYLPSATASYGVGITADGLFVVGGSWFGGLNWEATRWTWGGAIIGLGDLAGGDFDSTAYDVSDDGDVVVGRSDSALYPEGEAFRWTPSGGMVGLGALPGASQSTAMAVSANGSVVVGYCVSGGAWEAFYWTAETGMVSLRDLLVNTYGLDLTGWTLGSAAGISADGLTIVGGGAYILTTMGVGTYQGNQQGWIARIEPTSPPSVPTLSEWGLIVMMLLLLTAGIIALVFQRRYHQTPV